MCYMETEIIINDLPDGDYEIINKINYIYPKRLIKRKLIKKPIKNNDLELILKNNPIKKKLIKNN